MIATDRAAGCHDLRVTMPDVRGMLGRPVVAALLALCVCIYALEMSGRWDRSIEDANDEAGFVAIVLCIGVALAAGGSLIAYIRNARTTRQAVRAVLTLRRRCPDPRTVLPVLGNSPPASLRI
jgi:hypothetical protein